MSLLAHRHATVFFFTLITHSFVGFSFLAPKSSILPIFNLIERKSCIHSRIALAQCFRPFLRLDNILTRIDRSGNVRAFKASIERDGTRLGSEETQSAEELFELGRKLYVYKKQGEDVRREATEALLKSMVLEPSWATFDARMATGIFLC
jgi:hypothetical protein